MKVWIVEYLEFGAVSVWDTQTDPVEIPEVKTELSYLDGMESVREDFLDDLIRAIAQGYGEAEIPERIRVTLVDVRTR